MCSTYWIRCGLEIRKLIDGKSVWLTTGGLVWLDWTKPSSVFLSLRIHKGAGVVGLHVLPLRAKKNSPTYSYSRKQATLHSWPCPCLECLVHHVDESIINQLWPKHHGLGVKKLFCNTNFSILLYIKNQHSKIFSVFWTDIAYWQKMIFLWPAIAKHSNLFLLF